MIVKRLRSLSAGIWPRFSFVRIAARSGTNYTANIVWLMKKSLAGHTRTLTAIFGLGQLSLAVQASALLVLYWYAGAAQSNEVLSFGPLEVGARDPILLWAVVVASGMCFLLSAGFTYMSRGAVLTLGEDNIALGLTGIIDQARRLPDPRAPEASRIIIENGESGIRTVTTGCRLGAMAVVILVDAVTPLVGGVVAGMALFMIEPVLTALLVAGALLWSTLLYPLTLRQVMFANARGRENTAFKQDTRKYLEAGLSTDMPEKLDSAVGIAEAFLGRRRVVNEMTLVLGVGVTIIGALAAVYMASTIMAGGAEWPIFIIYLGGARIALTGLFAGPRTFGVISRFYPRMVIFIHFAKSMARLGKQELSRASKGDDIFLGTLPSGAAVQSQIGARIALVTYLRPSVVQLALLPARAAATGLPLASAWVQSAEINGQYTEKTPIRFVEFATLSAVSSSAAHAFLDSLSDGVTVITYRDETDLTQLGTFHERSLIAINDCTITENVPMGTAESRLVLEAFIEERAQVEAENAEKNARRGKVGSNDDTDDDEEN